MLNNYADQERMEFMVDRDGPSKAMYFANQCVHVYKAAVLASKRKHGKQGVYRKAYIKSYLFHKQYILENE